MCIYDLFTITYSHNMNSQLTTRNKFIIFPAPILYCLRCGTEFWPFLENECMICKIDFTYDWFFTSNQTMKYFLLHVRSKTKGITRRLINREIQTQHSIEFR